MVRAVEYVPGRGHYVEFFSTRGMVGKHIQRLGDRISLRAKRQVGVQTGRLRASIRSKIMEGRRGPMAIIGSSQRHALLHHEGSRPHQIFPNKRKALRFKQGGRIVYAHHVNHPGTKANKYLSDNLRAVVL